MPTKVYSLHNSTRFDSSRFRSLKGCKSTVSWQTTQIFGRSYFCPKQGSLHGSHNNWVEGNRTTTGIIIVIIVVRAQDSYYQNHYVTQKEGLLIAMMTLTASFWKLLVFAKTKAIYTEACAMKVDLMGIFLAECKFTLMRCCG